MSRNCTGEEQQSLVPPLSATGSVPSSTTVTQRSAEIRAVETFVLSSNEVRVEIDPGRGADILSVVALRTGTEILFSTPWRRRADAIRRGAATSGAVDSEQSWLEQYRGGWQTLCPNAGPPRKYRGAVLGFHGEASVVPWTLVAATTSKAHLTTELFTVPLTIHRSITLTGGSLQIIDQVVNNCGEELTIDYSHHPALGGDFLDSECDVTTNAARYTDDATNTARVIEGDFSTSALAHLPAPGIPAREFGWLSGFPDPGDAWAAVSNRALGLTIRLSWDSSVLPYAWWWQEFTATRDFPWFARARVFAVEPASTPTSGPLRVSALTIPPRSSIQIPLSLSIKQISPAAD